MCLHLVLNHMFHLCLFGVCSTLLQKCPLRSCQLHRWKGVNETCFPYSCHCHPIFAVHVFLHQLANADTSFVVLCMCNVYYTWYIHAGTVCVLVQFNPQTVLRWQYTWCIHGGVLCSPISNVYLLYWITHLLEGRAPVDPV